MSAAIASTSKLSASIPSSASSLSEDTIESCRELQQDELLALEAIYEKNFSHTSTSHDRGLVFSIRIDVDLQEEREVIVTEEAVAPAPAIAIQQLHASSNLSHATFHHVRGGRGRINANHPRGRGRGRNFGTLDSQAKMQAATSQSINMAKAQDTIAVATPAQEAMPPIQEHAVSLQYLPSIELVATLGPGYPLEEPPQVELRSFWLSEDLRKMLLERILPLWQNDSAMYLMVDEIQAAFTDGSLGEPLQLNDRYIFVPAVALPRQTLLSRLTTHDRLTRHSSFSSESFDCGICLETKKGARCSRLRNCKHVFCIECLYSFFELNIREGLVKNVSCADMQCVKERQEGKAQKGSVGLDEIESIVGKDLADRYKWLTEKQKIESDPTITYCPREACNAPVSKESDENYERLRICPSCSYSFCVYCRRTYHGTKSRCVFSHSSSIVDKYVNGDEKEKAALEVRYGKTNVRKLVEMYLEEQANAKWIKDNSTRCPDCQLDIEKSMGCSHMTCARCFSHFCFRCGSRLNGKDPYSHFSTPGLPCYNKLFDYQPSEDQQNANELAVFDAIIADLNAAAL